MYFLIEITINLLVAGYYKDDQLDNMVNRRAL